MEWFRSYRRCDYVLVLLGLLVSGWGWESCEGLAKLGFDIQHLYSDRVKQFLAFDGLPDSNSVEYYKVMAHRDRLIRGRRLASQNGSTPVTFSEGNQTLRIDSLGFLHYANVTVGTPAKWFLVALDTGSDLFWLPCDCTSCVHDLKSSRGARINLNIYSPNASSSSAKVPCNSTMCPKANQCPSDLSNCPYQVRYLSNGTSSTGFLVEDVLHLVTDDDRSKVVDARIALGCGQVQKGVFGEGAAPNGLFGLGLDDISVPSLLAKAGIASNSFSMCFGRDGTGRINFGDKGSLDQQETPLNIRQLHPTYNITISQINVGGNASDLEFSAVFDSGTSFTYLSDSAYTLLSESFDSLALDNRSSPDSDIPFEYCYELSPNQDSFKYPAVNLTMKGGGSYHVYHPLVVVSLEQTNVYCLGIIKSKDISIIGQNFMTDYRVVFDREKMILGWKESNCYSAENPAELPVIPPGSSAKPPVTSFNPEATNIPSQNTSCSTRLNLFPSGFILILPILALF